MITKLNDNFEELNNFIETLTPSQIFFLVDENTHEHCLPLLLANLETSIPFEILEIEVGEEMKNIETSAHLWGILSDFKADRKCLVINLGGGVITDLGGFISSTYKRGVAFIHIPTSLLAMCDASLGGKTGIDHCFLKNIVGTFALPQQVFFYPKFLETLPFKELRSGFAEMLKHGLIADKVHWEQLINIRELTPKNIEPHIGISMQIKQKIVETDFEEKHLRKTLNFGHTIGHALESLFIQNENPVPHGEMVALGMICETKLSELENLIDEKTSEYIIQNIRNFFPYINIDSLPNEIILSLMKNDKKNTNGTINFSLIKNIGEAVYNFKANENNITKALEFYRNLV